MTWHLVNTRSKVLHQWNWLEGDEGSAPNGARSYWLVRATHGRLLTERFIRAFVRCQGPKIPSVNDIDGVALVVHAP